MQTVLQLHVCKHAWELNTCEPDQNRQFLGYPCCQLVGSVASNRGASFYVNDNKAFQTKAVLYKTKDTDVRIREVNKCV